MTPSEELLHLLRALTHQLALLRWVQALRLLVELAIAFLLLWIALSIPRT